MNVTIEEVLEEIRSRELVPVPFDSTPLKGGTVSTVVSVGYADSEMPRFVVKINKPAVVQEECILSSEIPQKNRVFFPITSTGNF